MSCPLKISAFYMPFVLFVDLLFTSKNNGKMLTIKAEIKKDGQKVDGTYNVKLRFEERKEQDIDFIAFLRKWIENTAIEGVKNYATGLT